MSSLPNESEVGGEVGSLQIVYFELAKSLVFMPQFDCSSTQLHTKVATGTVLLPLFNMALNMALINEGCLTVVIGDFCLWPAKTFYSSTFPIIDRMANNIEDRTSLSCNPTAHISVASKAVFLTF